MNKKIINWKISDTKEYNFLITCVNYSAESIDNLITSSEEVSYNKLIKVIGLKKIKEIFDMYAWGKEKGLRMKNDYAIEFRRGIFENKPAYYIVWSAIEYIFT